MWKQSFSNMILISSQPWLSSAIGYKHDVIITQGEITYEMAEQDLVLRQKHVYNAVKLNSGGE